MVSVIIPTYKGYSELGRAIESVLNQSYDDIEIIVVDDNEADSKERIKTEQVMARYLESSRITYIKHEKNLNGAYARNTGISVAKGEYIAFLDDDDYYLSERINKSVQYLEKHDEYAGVYVGVDSVDFNNNVTLQIRPGEELMVSKLLIDENVIGTGSNIFLRKSILDQVRGFDVSFTRRQDTEFMLRICEAGRIGFISELLIIKCLNGTCNVPSYHKMRAIIEQFCDKFCDEIEQLGNKKKEIYATQYRSVFRAAIINGSPEDIREAMGLVEKYSPLKKSEKALAFLYIHNLRNRVTVSVILDVMKKLVSWRRKLRDH